MVKKVTAISLTVVMLIFMSFSFFACEEELPTAEELIEKLVEAQTDVKSYEMEGNMDVSMLMDIPEEEMLMDVPMGIPMDIAVLVDITGAFDGENEEMMMSMDMDIDMSGEVTMSMVMEMYVVEGWMYMMMDIPMMGPQWMKTEMPYSEVLQEIESIDFTKSQMEFLQSGDIVVTGVEKLDDIECYILELNPDMSKLWELLMEQIQMPGDTMPVMPGDEFEEMIESIDNIVKDISGTYWIEKDTYYIHKGEVAFTMEITPEAMGITDEEGSIAMDIAMDMIMYNYDKPVTIVLPPEAEDAVEESFW